MPTSAVQTLNGMTQLKESEFGRPWPRHGLKLLYWFSTKCIYFDENNEMVSCCNPRRGHYGFHYFNNTPDQYSVRLLPDADLYYVVGNLRSPRANRLPRYVRKGYTGEFDDSNKDRIIVSLDGEVFDRVYVTAHIDESEYDIDSTFRVSRGLLSNIRRHENVNDFLSEMDFCSPPDHSQHVRIAVPPNHNRTGSAVQVTRSRGFWESLCPIL